MTGKVYQLRMMWTRATLLRDTTEVFRNEILTAWQKLECRSDSYFLIHEFRNKDHFITFLQEWFLFLNSWIQWWGSLQHTGMLARLTCCQDFISKTCNDIYCLRTGMIKLHFMSIQHEKWIRAVHCRSNSVTAYLNQLEECVAV